jgi:hypothetical protein
MKLKLGGKEFIDHILSIAKHQACVLGEDKKCLAAQ